MLMKPEKKSMAALIMGAGGPKSPMDEMKSSNEQMAEKSQMDPGLLSAADDMIAAFEAKDAQGLAEALKAFMDISESSEGPEASEPPQE